jgi:argininosuccinate lyase
MPKLWGGRFDKETDKLLEQFNASIGFDQRLYHADIVGSQAYARALGRAGLLNEAEVAQIVEGLDEVRHEFEAGTFAFRPGDEDIHTAVERRLTEVIGDVAGKLHTGRSRNDQIATDVRLYLLDKIRDLNARVRALQRTIIEQAVAHIDVLMPGYTHLQPAQPIPFSHWLMSFFWMLQRDRERLHDLKGRVAVLPLGSGALAGNPFEIDREALAQDLGFANAHASVAGGQTNSPSYGGQTDSPSYGGQTDSLSYVSQNSLDAVADRDFVAEFLFWAALLQIHMSRIAEDLIIYASAEFGFVTLDDAYSTGSSLMPQKKNPDSLELTRGKTGRLVGNLVGLLTTLKGLPSTYNKDLQEDKEPLFDTLDTLEIELPVLTGVIATLRVNASRMQMALRDEMLATDLADYLVRKGVPFRESHHLVGQVVRAATSRGCPLRELPIDAYRGISPIFENDVYEVLDFRRAVEQKAVTGGTAKRALQTQIARAQALLELKR